MRSNMKMSSTPSFGVPGGSLIGCVVAKLLAKQKITAKLSMAYRLKGT
jgi:hypothetical protein